MKICILGGTFDPIHLGHIEMAQAVYNYLDDVDKVLFMPSKNPPHKRDKGITAVEDRVNMTKLAISDYDEMEFSDYDLLRTGPSYTSDLFASLKEEYKDCYIYFIIGGDSVRDIRKWHEVSYVLENCHLLVIGRDEVEDDNLDKIISDLKQDYNCNITKIPMRKISISSSFLRESLKENRDYESYEDMLNRNVFDYIINHNLYL